MFRNTLVFAFWWLVSFRVCECKVCSSIDVRNNVSNLYKLNDCTEIAGHLQILLISNVESEDEFDDYVFPELTQISGYLMFFNVAKLTSVGKILPNLRVIRGMQLFADYSLIVYDMPDLREIAIPNLMYVAKGLVKVDKCPRLCFVDTVDWSEIGASELHFTNVNNGTCEACPRNCGGNCWNSKQCQLTDGTNCHPECLGCSQNHSARHCDACRNYNNDGVCVNSCPKNKYVHNFTNKCITKKECTSWNGTWWTYENYCVSRCPPFYDNITENNETTCYYCGLECNSTCLGGDINTLNQLQRFVGCTKLNSTLTLSLNGNAVEQLESELFRCLGAVRSIKGALSIRRTKALRSLHFLNNLREVGGEEDMLENRMYAIFIYENQNLQALFNFSDPKFNLTITGKFAFHDNPLLCMSEIEKLANVTGQTFDTDVDVYPYSNGDKAACITFNMSVQVKANSTNASLSWEAPDSAPLIWYTLYFKVHEDGNDSTFDSKDTCLISPPWKSIFTSNNTIVLTKLDPFTTYAYYIKVLSSKAGQTKVKYFTTESDDPEKPKYLRVEALNHHTIYLEWVRPSPCNGELAFYKLDYNEEPDVYLNRNYCMHPRSLDGELIDMDSQYFEWKDMMVNEDPTPTAPGNCNCTTPVSTKASNPERKFDILMLDTFYSYCNGKFNNCNGLQYGTVNDSETFIVAKRRSNNVENLMNSKKPSIFPSNKSIIIDANRTSLNLTHLKHFTLYAFYFSACNHPTKLNRCSPILYSFARTLKKENADDIVHIKGKVKDANVDVEWSGPKDPNSDVLAYRVMYENVAAKHLIPSTECIPQHRRFNVSRLSLKNLQPGRYILKVQAESLAGLGRFSKPLTFDIASMQSGSRGAMLIAAPLVIGVVAIVGALMFYWWYKKKYHLDNIHLITSINPDYEGAAYVEDEWEVDRNDVDLEKDLGHGTFGTVYYGFIKSRNLPCAIKTVNESLSLHDHMEFLNEASVMKAFSKCHHVVRLLGVVSKGQPPLVIMELMERGDLKKYLRSTRDSSHSLTSNEIYRMAAEIADGMAYLAAKKFVHRDLAARNCMVAGDRTVKIGDFGMTRDIYETDYYRKETKGLLPVRWMAPESLADGVFTSDSDVWSFGIVLWEIATLAEQPYQGLSNEEVLQFVVSKGRLKRPPECSDLLYEFMRQCWCWRPNDRPTFWDIVERLENSVSQDFKLVSFIHSKEGLEHRIIHGRQRTYNPPALSIEPQEELYGHYRASDDEVSLHVGGVPRRSAPGYFRPSPDSAIDDFY